MWLPAAFTGGALLSNLRHTGRPLAHHRSAGDAAAEGVQRPQQLRPRIQRPDNRRRHHRRPPVASQLRVDHFDLPSRRSEGSKRYAKSRRDRPGIRSVPPAIWFLDFLQPTNRSSGQSTTPCHSRIPTLICHCEECPLIPSLSRDGAIPLHVTPKNPVHPVHPVHPGENPSLPPLPRWERVGVRVKFATTTFRHPEACRSRSW